MMNRMRWMGGIALAGTISALASGCGTKDTGTEVKGTPPPADPAQVRQQYQEVINNPNIPPQQKAAIAARMQGQVQGNNKAYDAAMEKAAEQRKQGGGQ